MKEIFSVKGPDGKLSIYEDGDKYAYRWYWDKNIDCYLTESEMISYAVSQVWEGKVTGGWSGGQHCYRDALYKFATDTYTEEEIALAILSSM